MSPDNKDEEDMEWTDQQWDQWHKKEEWKKKDHWKTNGNNGEAKTLSGIRPPWEKKPINLTPKNIWRDPSLTFLVEGETVDLTELMAKSILSLKHQTRSTQAATMDTVRVKSQNVFFAISKRSAKEYIEKVDAGGSKEQKNKLRESMGPLHLHVWNAWLKELVDATDAFLVDSEEKLKAAQMARDDMDPKTLEHFQECMTQVNDLKTNSLKITQYKTYWEESPTRVLREVRVIKTEKCHDSNFKKLITHLLPGSNSEGMWLLMLDLLVHRDQAAVLHGTAPKGQQDRLLQAFMDQKDL